MAKSTLDYYRPRLLGADHLWKIGAQFERGEHVTPVVIPTGTRFVDNAGSPFQTISSPPSNTGGEFLTESAFVTDAITIGNRATVHAGFRFDHTRAISQDLHAVDGEGHEVGDIVRGLGTLYTWNRVSPRLGFTMRLSDDGRTTARASYGRFVQGVMTGEIGVFHPGAPTTTTAFFDQTTGRYTRNVTRVDPKTQIQFDPHMRAPRTDESSVGLNREMGHSLAVGLTYVHKNGRDFIGWTDVGGHYVSGQSAPLADGRVLPVQILTNLPSDRRFLLSNPDGYALRYDGLVSVVEKRRAHGWQAFGSYTWSRVSGLMASSGAVAAGPQVSTVGPPPVPQGLTFGRDPNDLTNARGLLPNDRPHLFRAMTSVDIPRTGLVVAANLQYASGKPWAASTQVDMSKSGQGDLRILLEPRGSRRLSSQSLLDLRVSRAFVLEGAGRVELIVDVLNALNNSAEEALATDNLFSPNFGRPTIFVDPRRVMFSVRLNLGH
jgi:hypothetical protein